MPRQLTAEEMREKFLTSVSNIVEYWHNEKRVPEPLAKMEGVVHSIFVLLEGMSGGCDFGLALVPVTHPDTPRSLAEEGENYPPVNDKLEAQGVINGGDFDFLHHEWSARFAPSVRFARTDEEEG